ncbi:protein of unknown function [Georgfuchsia toluolica]|uniref:Uncharacterized protein n=1 Tax=Georgfuchsia toluolica TaxID=424218 RepID=A0A916NIK6_9PROT|nr:protein of unknown function [Georgfuchsia toluolica]
MRKLSRSKFDEGYADALPLNGKKVKEIQVQFQDSGADPLSSSAAQLGTEGGGTWAPCTALG